MKVITTVLSKYTDLEFPHFIVLKASAGSGKTYALSQRYIRLIISERTPRNHLKNILAVTFSNNAAKEMRHRVIKFLKNMYFKEPKIIDEFISLVSRDREELSKKAESLIEEILSNYSDFQIKTIDSFIASIFKASAIDFGYNPDFEIVMNIDSFMEYSFELFLKKVKEGSAEAVLLNDVIDIIHEQKRAESSFLWDPVSKLLEEIKDLYLKIASTNKKPVIEDYFQKIKVKCQQIKEKIQEINDAIKQSGLEINGNSSFQKILEIITKGQFSNLISVRLKNLPVKKPNKKSNKQDSYDNIGRMWSDATDLIKDYINLYSRSFYLPYLRVYSEFADIIEMVKRHQDKVFIGDINYYLASYLDSHIVPDIYFRIGEKIYHYLIDEFQDTSPIQWKNLSPLIANSLSQDGSLFVVGDTKQAIYRFRDTDYRIMKRAEQENEFPSAKHIVSELSTNFRSLPEILRFNEKIFKEEVCSNEKYREPAKRSGLDSYRQEARQDVADGYVSYSLIKKDDETLPEKHKIREIINDAQQRGYSFSDITILAIRNEDVVRISQWLNEYNIEFISLSSLDVRQRKITKEILSLLSFLDSPIDDLSFAAFIMGEIFTENLALRGIKDPVTLIHNFLLAFREEIPLYKAFQNNFRGLWDEFFDELFKLSGYLPLYELTIGIMNTFKLFAIKPHEEASLIKILETIKTFESLGANSLKDFLDFADSDSSTSEWDISLPSNANAVKVMTIHKSKGLGFPICIVVLYKETDKGFKYILEESNNSVNILKINRNMTENNLTLNAIYNEEWVSEAVNKINTLYVGLTRAESELYVIAVKGEKDGYPFYFFPKTDYITGSKVSKIKSFSDNQKPLGLTYNLKITAESTADASLNLYERLWGDYIHRVLSLINHVNEAFEEDLSAIITKLNREMKTEHPYKEISEIVKRVVNHDSLKDFFLEKPQRIIRNEMEIVSNIGRLFRIDRVIIDPDEITILEYKTGLDKKDLEKHIQQVNNYIKILKEIFPIKKHLAMIVYIDMKDKVGIVKVK